MAVLLVRGLFEVAVASIPWVAVGPFASLGVNAAKRRLLSAGCAKLLRFEIEIMSCISRRLGH